MRLNKGRPAGLGLMMLAVVLALLSSSISLVWALPKEVAPQDSKIWDWKCLQKNNFFMGITNYGILGQDKGGGNAYGFWPAPAIDANGDLVPPTMNYIFGWGLWIGAQIRSTKPGKTRDTMCTVGYNPNNGAGEYTAGAVIGGVPQSVTAADVKIATSLDTDWPLNTTSGADSVVSVIDTRSIYNDYAPLKHATGGVPLKVEVIQTTYQWNYPTNQDIIFFLFEVKNTGTDSLFDVYLAPTADCDIGNESGTAANDVCYFDVTTNMAYQYQVDSSEGGWNRTAGCVGFMFLESPKATKDYTFPDGYKIYKNNSIGLFAFKVFNINIDPPGNLEQYKELAGYDYTTGKFLRFDPKPASGDQRFMESTGPIDMAPGATAKTIVAVICANFDYAYLNVNDTLAIADLRAKAKAAQLIYDSNWLLPGPPPSPALTITPGHRRVIIGWDKSSEDSLNPKNKNLLYAQKVTRDSSTLAKFDPNFLVNILEGYKLYKSTDGATWNLLGQWDKDDNILVDTTGITITGPESFNACSVVVFDPITSTPLLYGSYVNPLPLVLPGASTFFPLTSHPSLTQGTNSGLQYSYVDENLINGFTYYYAVTAYGVNWSSVLDISKTSIISKEPGYFETATSENVTPVVPRSEPNDYLASQAWISENTGISYGKTLLVAPSVDLPRQIKSAKYRQVWGPVTRGQVDGLTYTPKLSYTVLDEATGLTLVPWTYANMDVKPYRDSTMWVKSIKYTPGNYLTIVNQAGPVVKSSFKVNQVIVPAAYTVSNTALAKFPPTPDLRWAFRSGNYEVRWTVTGTSPNDTLWPEVWHVVDSVKSIVVKVPYDSVRLDSCKSSSWNVGGLTNTMGRRYIVNVSSFFLKWMNICGMRLFFNNPTNTTLGSNMVWADKPANGDVWKIRTAGVSGPVEGEYQIINASEYQFTSSVVDLKKIGVVPNPYIVRNIWERTNDRNKLQFVNLPSKCTVKIYTLAGNLIKVLEHDDNAGRDGGTCWWDPMLTMNQQMIASGVYLYYIDAPGVGTHVGKFAVIR